MERRRGLNQGQPQTLIIACFLLYINAAFGLLGLLAGGSIRLSGIGFLYYGILIGGGLLGGYGIANERKWGYILAIVTAFSPFVISFIELHNPLAGSDLISLIFEIALVVLLLHTQSREYQKVWFK